MVHNISIEERSTVYPVLEDTLLLADSINVRKGDRVLEVGCGTGYVSIRAALMGGKVVGVDINPDAVRLSRENASLNGIDWIDFHESDMFENVDGLFDVIMFNPPYLPSEEFQSGDYDACWDGGKGGRGVSDRFIDGLDGHLGQGGVVYLLQSTLCDPELSIRRLGGIGLEAKIVGSKKLFFEELVVIMAKKS